MKIYKTKVIEALKNFLMLSISDGSGWQPQGPRFPH